MCTEIRGMSTHMSEYERDIYIFEVATMNGPKRNGEAKKTAKSSREAAEKAAESGSDKTKAVVN